MSGCCTVPSGSAVGVCPGCGKSGREVAGKTVRAILKPSAAAGLDKEAYRFCDEPTCDVLYFDGAFAARKDQASIRIGIKETEDPVSLCYCFEFTRADVRAQVQATGRSTIPERIAAEIKAGHCACETKNPSGVCCLGEVRKAVKTAQAESVAATGARP